MNKLIRTNQSKIRSLHKRLPPEPVYSFETDSYVMLGCSSMSLQLW